jgi:hypothetical protein
MLNDLAVVKAVILLGSRLKVPISLRRDAMDGIYDGVKAIGFFQIYDGCCISRLRSQVFRTIFIPSDIFLTFGIVHVICYTHLSTSRIS